MLISTQHIQLIERKSKWYSPKFLIKDGKMQIPAGNGLGVTYDAGIWAKEEKL